MKIETEYKTITVFIGDGLTDDEICLRIEDNDSFTGVLNLCWLKEEEASKLIEYLHAAKRKLKQRRKKIDELKRNTNFNQLYFEFEQKYNHYPIQMCRESAFIHALNDGLIDEDTFYAARDYYGRLWNYVGD